MTGPKEKVKKARERRHLERLRQSLPSFPDGAVRDAEAPDFIVECNDGTIGVEHTELFLDDSPGVGSALRAKEGEWAKAVLNACRLYEERTLPAVDVAVFWLDHYPLTSKRRKEISREIADCVERALPMAEPTVTLEQTDLSDSPLPEEIDAIRVAKFPELTVNRWNYPRSGYVASLSVDQIRNAIAEKERRLEAYQSSCSQVWLVLVIEGLYASSLIEIAESVRTTSFITGFDRLLLMRYFEGEVIELRKAQQFVRRRRTSGWSER